MKTCGVAEPEWRKVSNAGDAVNAVRLRFSKLLTSLGKVTDEVREYVPELSFDINDDPKAAVIKSFAGSSDVRLGWSVAGQVLEGVAIFSSKKDDENQPEIIFKAFIRPYGGGYFMVNDEVVSEGEFQRDVYCYSLLMNVVYRQAEFSSI